MKVGLLVDGDTEYYALPNLLPRLGSPHQVLSQPLKCDLQPLSSPAQIGLAASKRFSILLSKGVDSIVILIDKETRQDCTIELVRAIEYEARMRLKDFSSTVDLHVVLKISKFENWMVADPQAVGDLIGMFDQVERIAKKVTRGRADAVDAWNLLKTCARQHRYDKIKGAVAICKRLSTFRAAENSRSFRKFLKVLGIPPKDLHPRRSSRRGK